MMEQFTVKACEFTCAKKFLDALDETNKRWQGKTWIFRGQNDASWLLLPPSLRLEFSLDYVARFWENAHFPRWRKINGLTVAPAKTPENSDFFQGITMLRQSGP